MSAGTPRCCLSCGRWGNRGFRPADDGREGWVCSNDRACNGRIDAMMHREPDPIGDIADSTGRYVHDCKSPRRCKDCRRAASLIWQCSPGHREVWYGRVERALADAIRDVCWRAQPYGETEDGDTFAYLVTKGAMHRLIGAAQGAGISAAFRAHVAPADPSQPGSGQ